MQLSLFDKPAGETDVERVVTTTYYCDVFVCSVWDEKKKHIRMRPLPKQAPSCELYIRCSHKARKLFPIGTIFKIDLRLAEGKKGNPFLIARAGKPMQRAIEYFEHNIQLQKIK
jgi:hypothetical protein